MKIVKKPAAEVVDGDVLILDGIPWTVQWVSTADLVNKTGCIGATRVVNGVEWTLMCDTKLRNGRLNIVEIAEEWP